MERSVTKLDSSHDEMCITMQSDSESDGWMRVFPHPMPSTHRLTHRWEGNKLYVRPEPLPVAAPQAPAAQSPAPVQSTPTTSDANPPQTLTITEATEKHRKELEALTEADLITRGAELGLRLKRSMAKALMVAEILKKEFQPPQAPAPQAE